MSGKSWRSGWIQNSTVKTGELANGSSKVVAHARGLALDMMRTPKAVIEVRDRKFSSSDSHVSMSFSRMNLLQVGP